MKTIETIYINGKWVKPQGAERTVVYDSFSEEAFAEVALGDERDIDLAVIAARNALAAWSAWSPADRAAVLLRIREGLKQRRDDLAKTITREVGMPIKLCKRIQIDTPLSMLEISAMHAEDCQYEEEIQNSRVVREPIGVVGAITAWNYPLYLIVSKVAPALAAGCTVVLKPSEIAPLSAYELCEVCEEAGLPAGVLNCVVGTGSVAGNAISRHPDIDMVTFTGSTQAGRQVGAQASASVKRVTLELGGKSAAIILDDADLPKAVKASVNMCFLNSGQTCAAITRILVPADRYDEVAALAVDIAEGFRAGDPQLEETRFGPLASVTQRDRVLDYIRRGLDDGATLLSGGLGQPDGPSSGNFVKPTIFGRVDPNSAIAQEEIFGPVLCIIPYDDEREAISIANGTIFGLAGTVWSKDDGHAEVVARQLRAGQVDINGGQFNLEAPFGGYKQSGNGREQGRFGIEEFQELKSLQFRMER